jgi:hypothetical protein
MSFKTRPGIQTDHYSDGVYVFKDGINAALDATDYKKEMIRISSDNKLNIK